jgi:hypothetical protein
VDLPEASQLESGTGIQRFQLALLESRALDPQPLQQMHSTKFGQRTNEYDRDFVGKFLGDAGKDLLERHLLRLSGLS